MFFGPSDIKSSCFSQHGGYDIIFKESILAHSLGCLELISCLCSMQRLKMVKWYFAGWRNCHNGFELPSWEGFWQFQICQSLLEVELQVWCSTWHSGWCLEDLGTWAAGEHWAVHWGWARCRCSMRMTNGSFSFSMESLFSTHILLKKQKSTCTWNLPCDHCELCRMLEKTRKWTRRPLELKTSKRNQYCFWLPTKFILERISAPYSSDKENDWEHGKGKIKKQIKHRLHL